MTLAAQLMSAHALPRELDQVRFSGLGRETDCAVASLREDAVLLPDGPNAGPGARDYAWAAPEALDLGVLRYAVAEFGSDREAAFGTEAKDA